MPAKLPECPVCKQPLPRESFNVGTLGKCPACLQAVWIEAFPGLGREPARGRAAELRVNGDEAHCFYHESKKASAVCEACGRFLCALCDCTVGAKSYCPGCIDKSRSAGPIQELETSRTLYGRIAFILAILPLYITGIAAVYVALRYWKAPESIVRPHRWMFPAALVLGGIQTLVFTGFIIAGCIAK